MPKTTTIIACIAVGLLCLASAAGLWLAWKPARAAAQILAVRDDPGALSEALLQAPARPDARDIEREIDAALAANDVSLAESFVALAHSLDIAIPDDAAMRIDAARRQSKSASHLAGRFASGFVTGDVSDAASLTGTLTGDLLVFGDIRDAVREGKHFIAGEDVDRLVLGLACVGLVVTAGTYASIGIAAPVRGGVSAIKDARRLGRLSAPLGEWAGRSMRGMIDRPALEGALRNVSVTRPASAVEALKAAVKLDRAGEVITVLKDIGRVGEKAGVRATFDVLQVAEEPADVARAARLAAVQGGKTRAVIKILGRGALLLTAGTFSLVSWIFAAVAALFGLVTSIKAATERLALASFARHRLKRQRRALALANAAV